MDKDNVEKYLAHSFGHKSLYTWVKNTITLPVVSDIYPSSVFISSIREDGFNLGHTIYNKRDTKPQQGERDNFTHSFKKKIEEVIVSIKEARMHERSLVHVEWVERNGRENSKTYLITRFHDQEYIHETFGKKIKQIITAEEVKEEYYEIYKKHFLISSLVYSLVSGRETILPILISKDTLNEEILNNRLNGVDSFTQKDSLEEISKMLNKLSFYMRSLTSDELSQLKELPYLGQPNYSITHDNKLRIYVKASSAEAYGNGNAFSFILS